MKLAARAMAAASAGNIIAASGRAAGSPDADAGKATPTDRRLASRATGDPRARRGDRGSGLARARKQPQAVIVGGVSLEATPPARQDYAETASIIVNGRKGL